MYHIEDRAFKWHISRSILVDNAITWEQHKKNCEEEYKRNNNKKSIKKIKKDNENILLNFTKRKEE